MFKNWTIRIWKKNIILYVAIYTCFSFNSNFLASLYTYLIFDFQIF